MVMSSGLMKIVTPCWKPSSGGREGGSSAALARKGANVGAGRADGLLWYKDLGQHVSGEFSMSVVQANSSLEDHSQVEAGSLSLSDAGPCGTFIGVYDGHGGPEAARYVADHLFGNFKKIASEQNGISADVIRKAYSATEEGFLSLVKKYWLNKPQIASVGSCCLVGVISDGILYVANAGDARAVLGTSSGARQVTAQQLSKEHNASLESVRKELYLLHPEDPHIVVLKHNVWRVKGLIQISRSIGDAYLKNPEFNKAPLLPKFRLPERFHGQILSPEPSITTHMLCPEDQFLIFASDGLWEHLSNQEAVDIVSNCPRNGIAKKLVKTAMQEAAKKREMRYTDLQKIDCGVRRHFHDDITVIVLFFDSNLISKSSYNGPIVSVRGNGVPMQPDKF